MPVVDSYCPGCGGYHNPPAGNKRRHYGKVQQVMGEFKRGTLHSGSKHGPKVKSRRQAIAIALAQARREQ
jgi:hypothetical protein